MPVVPCAPINSSQLLLLFTNAVDDKVHHTQNSSTPMPWITIKVPYSTAVCAVGSFSEENGIRIHPCSFLSIS